MGKIKFVLFIFVFIMVFCIIGVFFVQADEEIIEKKDILEIQNDITYGNSVYGYSIDNPKIIVDPYKSNYNSALIVFETNDYINIKVNVNDIYSFVTSKSNKHFIGVYNLLSGNNYVILSYGNVNKKIEINIVDGESKFDLYNVTLLSNNHILVPTDTYVENGNYAGIREIDVLGKIYYEYLFETGYKGISCEVDDDKIALLSDNLIIIDRQNGDILYSYDISKYNYNWYAMKKINNKIVLFSDEGDISVDVNGIVDNYEGNYENVAFEGDINYSLVAGVRFYEKIVTKVSNNNIWLLNYDKMNDDINIEKEFNRLVVSGDNIKDNDVYLILDKLFDKRIYKLDNDINYIYTYDFNGKYSIYFKIDNNVYKTNKYLSF